MFLMHICVENVNLVSLIAEFPKLIFFISPPLTINLKIIGPLIIYP